MKNILPSKKFSRVILLTLVGVGVYFAGSYFLTNPSFSREAEEFNIASYTETKEGDQDNDGLLDWEESLWKMDPLNPDTDGNGILDGQEVFAARENLKDQVEIYEETGPQTNTSLIAKQLLTVASTIQSDPNLSQADLQGIMGSYLADVGGDYVDLYSSTDIIINRAQEPGLYYSDLEKALTEESGEIGSDLATVERAIEANTERYLRRLSSNNKIYQGMIEDMKKIDVPAQTSKSHLGMMNSLNKIILANKDLSQYFSDPVLAMRGVVGYLKAEEEFYFHTTELQKYFISSGILN
jgi:hypothetical protein